MIFGDGWLIISVAGESRMYTSEFLTDGLKDFYTTTDDHVLVELSSLVPAARIYYTLDGSHDG